jgi:hypothetical protein
MSQSTIRIVGYLTVPNRGFIDRNFARVGMKFLFYPWDESRGFRPRVTLPHTTEDSSEQNGGIQVLREMNLITWTTDET